MSKNVKELINCVKDASETFPQIKSNNKYIPAWNNEVKPTRDISLFWHQLRVDNGRPRQGVVADVMRSTRDKYHYVLRNVRCNEEQLSKTETVDHIT